jgi:hypothetical protein
MSSAGTAKKYHIPAPMEYQSNEQLEQWAADPNCIEAAECAAFLAKRKEIQAAESAALQARRALKRKELEDNPFDPRTEVSADAKHIANKVVTHLWILFVALPVVLAILYSMLAH